MLKHLRKHSRAEKAGDVQPGRVRWLKPTRQMKDTCRCSRYLNKTLNSGCGPVKIPEAAAKASAAEAALDAGYVFWQVCSDELTPKLAAFTGLFGCCKFKQMMLGINFAPGIFQRVIARISEGLQGADVITDGLGIQTRHLYEQKERSRLVLQTARMLSVKCQKPHLKAHNGQLQIK